jgi:hypothetical protein
MKFWVLDERDRYSRETPLSCFYEVVEPFVLEDCTQVCPACRKVTCPRLSSSSCGDLVLGSSFELVVSQAFVVAFEAAGLRGVDSLRPINMISKSKKPVISPRYFAARPAISFTRIDEKASRFVWEVPPDCPHCRLGFNASFARVVVDESTWDGNDVFMATGLYGVKLVSDRFVRTVRDAGLTNFVFVDSDDFSR